MVKMLSQAQLDDYHEHGYAVIESALPADMLAELQALTDELVAGAAGLSQDDERYDLEETHTPEHPRVRRLKSPYEHWPFFDRLLRDPVVLDVIEPILGPDIRLYNNKMNMKSPEYGAAVEWHQDWAFYPHTNDDGLAVGIYLDDVDEENAPMMVVPGSHKGPVHDHHDPEGYFCGGMDPVKCPMDYENAAKLMGPAGSMTLHHVRAVHGSALNRSGKQRRLLLMGYFAADAWPLVGFRPGETLDDFKAKIVRGTQSLEPRLEKVPARMALPKAPYQGSIYENQHTLEHRYFDTVEAAE